MKRPIIGITANHSAENGQYKLNKAYSEAVTAAGGLAVILPLTPEESLIRNYIKEIDGLLLTGGTDIDPLLYGEDPLPMGGKIDPLRDYFELKLAEEANSFELPVLGICKGCQVLNVAMGGTLYQDLYKQKTAYLKHFQDAPRWYPTHRIDVMSSSILHQITKKSSTRVNSIHHQAIKDPAICFNITARAGDGVIEAIERKDGRFVLGVQWHPETMWENSEENFNLFREFIKQSRK